MTQTVSALRYLARDQLGPTSTAPRPPPPPKPIEWIGETDGFLRLIDQTRLPTELVYLDCRTAEQVWEAIKMLRVRGAPAIGVSAAYGVIIGLKSATANHDGFSKRLAEVTTYLAESRPTAVNLFWALDRMKRVANGLPGTPGERLERLLAEAREIEREDREMCAAIGRSRGAAAQERDGGPDPLQRRRTGDRGGRHRVGRLLLRGGRRESPSMSMPMKRGRSSRGPG